MATRYFKTTGTAWNTASHWSATSPAGVDNAGVPTTADDVIFDNTSGNCNLITTAGVCRSLDMGTGGTKYAGTFSGNVTLTMGTSTAPPGGIALRLSSTCTWTHTGNVGFTSSAGATLVTVDFAGLTMGGSVTNTMGTGATWKLLSALTCLGTVQRSSATANTILDFNGQNVTCNAWTMNSGTGTVSMGNGGVITITANATTFTFTAPTLDAGTSEFKLTGTGQTSINATGQNFYKLTRTGPATQSGSFNLVNNFGILTGGTLQLDGNSVINRLLVQSNVVGTQRTITLAGTATIAGANTDFMDIGTSVACDISAMTGGSGDCGGNTNLTFTTADTQTAAVGTASFTWTTYAWVGNVTSRIPLPQDNVVIANAFVAGRTITVDMPRLCKNLTCTCTGSPLMSFTANPAAIYGNIVFAAGMTTQSQMDLRGRGATYTITCNGISIGSNILVNCPTGTYSPADTFNSARSAFIALSVTTGTWNDAGQTMNFTSTGSGVTINGGALTMTGTWNFSTTVVGTFWAYTSGTITGTGSTINVNGNSAVARTFAAGNQTYGILNFVSAGSTGQVTITGGGTFQEIHFSDSVNAKILAFTSSTTITITTVNGFDVQHAVQVMSVIAVTSGTFFALTSTLDQTVTNTSIKDSHAGGGGYFVDYAGTNVSGNTGWHFPASVIGDTNDVRWDVRTTQADTCDARWSVLTAIADACDFQWDVELALAAILATSDLQWDVRAALNDTNDLQWDIRNLLSDTSELQWAVSGLVSDTTDIIWDVRSLIADTSDLQWGVRTLIGDTGDLRWLIRSLIADTFDLQWSIRVLTSDSVDLIWDIRSLLGDSSDLQWDIRSLLADSSDLQWGARTSIGDTADLRWSLEFLRRFYNTSTYETRPALSEITDHTINDLEAHYYNIRQ